MSTSKGKTVVRGGFGVLYSPQMPGMVRQSVAHPDHPVPRELELWMKRATWA